MIETATLDYRVREGKDDAVGWRRHLHRNPEISFHEDSFHGEETSQFVQETLLSFGGLELSRPTPTSVVARLMGTVRDRWSPCGRAWTRCL